jgi:hypothetical protein
VVDRPAICLGLSKEMVKDICPSESSLESRNRSLAHCESRFDA